MAAITVSDAAVGTLRRRLSVLVLGVCLRPIVDVIAVDMIAVVMARVIVSVAVEMWCGIVLALLLRSAHPMHMGGRDQLTGQHTADDEQRDAAPKHEDCLTFHLQCTPADLLRQLARRPNGQNAGEELYLQARSHEWQFAAGR